MRGITRTACRFLAIFLVAGLVYSFFATYGRFVFPRDEYHRYELLSKGYLSGQLGLATNPPQELLALPDPYDPDQNEKIRLHDASLYQGKYYLYFGPAPVLFAYLPIRLLTGSFPPDSLVMVLFCAAGVAWLGLILLDVRDRMPSKLGAPSTLLLLLALGMANGIPFLMARTAVYEVAISGGFFFTSLAAYLLYRILIDRITVWRAAALSAAIGFATASRPHFALLSLLLPALLFYCVRKAPGRQKGSWAAISLALALPVTLCGALLAVYNTARFGSFLEFGINYQLAGFNIHKQAFFTANLTTLFEHMRAGLYLYLFEGMVIHNRFPFFSANTHLPTWLVPATTYFVEPVYGILNSNFLVVPAILGAILIARSKMAPLRPFLAFLAFIGATVVIMLGVLCAGIGVTGRYLVDFAGLWGLLISVVILVARSARVGRGARALGILADLTAGLVVLIGFFLGIQGYHDDFRTANPGLFEQIQNFSKGHSQK